MRGLILLLAVVLLLALVGWISFSAGPDRASINLEKQEIKQDTREILDAGEQAIDQAREEVNHTEPDADSNEPATTPVGAP